MELLILIPSLLIFLYTLFKLSGDDHVLIRKNISLEQMFDSAFNTLWISIIFSRIFYFVFHSGNNGNIFLAFFSTSGGLSLTGAVIGGTAALYLIAMLKKVPLGRIFDFISLSFLFALPAGFVGLAFFHQKNMIAYLISAAAYLLIAILFRKFLYTKLLNKTLREGTMGILFLLCFSIVSFATTFIDFANVARMVLSLQNIAHVIIFLLSIFLLIKQERTKLRRRA